MKIIKSVLGTVKSFAFAIIKFSFGMQVEEVVSDTQKNKTGSHLIIKWVLSTWRSLYFLL